MGNLSWGTKEGEPLKKWVGVIMYIGAEDTNDGGVRIDFPVPDLDTRLEEIKLKYGTEELRMLAYETELGLDFKPYMDFYELNDTLVELNTVHMNDRDLIMAIAEIYPSETLDHIILNKGDYTLRRHINSNSDLAYDYFSVMGIELPDIVMNNVNMDGLGKDLMDEGNQDFTRYGLLLS